MAEMATYFATELRLRMWEVGRSVQQKEFRVSCVRTNHQPNNPLNFMPPVNVPSLTNRKGHPCATNPIASTSSKKILLPVFYHHALSSLSFLSRIGGQTNVVGRS